MQWEKPAKELMRNECTGKIYTPPGGDIQNQEKEIIALGKIYTGERRKRETLEKKDKGNGEKRNTRYYGVGRFLPPFQKSPIKILSRLFLNILPIFPRYTHFPLIKTLSLSPNPIFPEWKGFCFKTSSIRSSRKNRYTKDKKTKGDTC